MRKGSLIKILKADLRRVASSERAKNLARFFKTGPGQYGEGDQFIGVTVPQSRTVAKKYKDLPFEEIPTLLHSRIHEERLAALLILIEQFKVADQRNDEKTREKIYRFYLDNTEYINNWDLIDLSAEKIIGPYLEDKPKDVLKKLAKSVSLWERRIAVLSTFHFIKQGEPKHTLEIAAILLRDKHDLIHKAVGWMLREVGKTCGEKILTDFLDKHASTMPRTMLRYAIEKFPEEKRQKYL
ncbi:MAG: DNA alkylation repair protein [Candidatus Woykebacteria bacterium RBG_16_43_9]|uniref:DNA alkylation repair protein n=1 Tax=Candidatus Woykebacteria bacterium RBG_16_43_9 TaxID=1802596 RepID=A0A1G1WFP0_9BACT|nr:MAG: DNA alkylation repair protein [Candidatus Woykebacteria bacterium RBG_16_43_9]